MAQATALATTRSDPVPALFSPAGSVIDPGSPEFREHLEAGAVELAAVFAESTAAMRRHWEAFRSSTARLDAVIGGADDREYRRSFFDVGLYHAGRHVYENEKDPAIEQVIRRMNVDVWELLIDKLGVKNLMSIARRKEFEDQLKRGDVPEVTAENIVAVINGLADRAAEFATEAAKDALKLLTPASGYYKTNSGFKVGRRAILSCYVDEGWSDKKFRVSYHRDAELTAIDGAFHILDEKGLIKGRKSPLREAIEASPDGRGETEYYYFTCYKNRNLHLTFKRLDLVKKLNGLASGEYVLGDE